MRIILTLILLNFSSASDQEIDIGPLSLELEYLSEDDSGIVETLPQNSPLQDGGQQQEDSHSQSDICEKSIADLRYFETEKGMSEVSELTEELVRYRTLLQTHKTDFERAISENNLTSIFLNALIEIRQHSGLEELQVYYAQIYYDEQITALYQRLDTGRTTLNKSLAAHQYRTSRTQEAINSLNVYAVLLDLNTKSTPAYLGKIMQFFSQDESAQVYFPTIFKNLETDQQCDLMDVGLTYLIERYRRDRNWVNRVLHYWGLKHSYTREAISTLLNIAKLLQITVRDNYQKLMEITDDEMIESTLIYILSFGYEQ